MITVLAFGGAAGCGAVTCATGSVGAGGGGTSIFRGCETGSADTGGTTTGIGAGATGAADVGFGASFTFATAAGLGFRAATTARAEMNPDRCAGGSTFTASTATGAAAEITRSGVTAAVSVSTATAGGFGFGTTFSGGPDNRNAAPPATKQPRANARKVLGFTANLPTHSTYTGRVPFRRDVRASVQ